MNEKDRLVRILESMLELYKELTGITLREREYLSRVDIENLAKLIDIKQYAALKIKQLSLQLKEILKQRNASSLSEWLILYKDDDAGKIKQLSERLKEQVDKFKRESEINNQITQESVSFYNGMINFYLSFLNNLKESYNSDATVDIEQQNLSMRV